MVSDKPEMSQDRLTTQSSQLGSISKSDYVIQKSGSLLYFRCGNLKAWRTVSIPKSIREHLSDVAGTERFTKVISVVAQSRMLVGSLSSLLFGLFGEHSGSDLIIKSTTDLLSRIAIEESSDKTLQQVAFSIYESLNDKYSNMSVARRSELVPRLFGDDVTLEVELMGWYDFVMSSEARLIDSRYNDAQMSPEYLFEYKSRIFLVAKCRTGKPVVLPVGSDIRTCDQAQRWIIGDTIVGLPLPSVNFIGRH